MGNNRKIPSTSTLLPGLLVGLVSVGAIFGFGSAFAQTTSTSTTNSTVHACIAALSSL